MEAYYTLIPFNLILISLIPFCYIKLRNEK